MTQRLDPDQSSATLRQRVRRLERLMEDMQSDDEVEVRIYGTKGLNSYSLMCHMANERWWQDPATGQRIERNDGELLMLIVSEIAEAMEGVRKDLQDDKLPHRKMVEVELADALIRIFDYAGGRGLDLEGAFEEKMAYNARREDHTHEARLREGGKRF